MTRAIHRTTLNAMTLYEFLVAHQEVKYTKKELLEVIELEGADESTEDALFASAIRIARTFAEEDGLFIPDAVGRNGFTYVLTDNPENITGSWVTNKRRTSGMARRTKRHSDALDPRMNLLPAGQRTILKQIQVYDREQEELDSKRGEAYEDLLMALIDAGVEVEHSESDS